MSNRRPPPPGQLPGQLNIFQAAESMGAAEALRQAAQALESAALTLEDAAAALVTDPNETDPPTAADLSKAARAARTAANQARQEADR